MNLLLILWGLFFLFLFVLTVKHLIYLKWLKKIKSAPITSEELTILNRFPEYNCLNETQKKILLFKIRRFIKEKNFIGIKIDITPQIKYTISFYACLITLGYEMFCYPSLENIYIYPHTIKKEELLISGEATKDSVVIAWDEAKKDINKSQNVTIHEFAHELDFEEGNINGIPPIPKSLYSQWNKIMIKEFKKFQQKIIKNRFLGKYSLIDKYAATNEGEFFAVLSEYYFKKPKLLKKHFPKIYEEMKKFYKVSFDVC